MVIVHIATSRLNISVVFTTFVPVKKFIHLFEEDIKRGSKMTKLVELS